jgi:hypothetical protein
MAGTIDFDQRLAVPEHVAMRELDEELVLLNFESERYFGLDDVGARILEVLRDASSIDAGITVLLDEFEVDESQLRHDVGALVTSLVDGGLVVLEPA